MAPLVPAVPALIIEVLGYLAAALVFLTFYTRSMLPLRYIGILSNVAFIGYGLLAQLQPVLLLHTILLPLNVIRLVQFRRLIADVAAAADGDFSIDWLLPYMKRQRMAAGRYLFHSGDRADRMYYIARGEVWLPEVGAQSTAGQVIGEIGIFSPQGRRISSAQRRTDCTFMTISCDEVMDLYYQNPRFGFYLLRLITGRLIDEVDRLKQQPEGRR